MGNDSYKNHASEGSSEEEEKKLKSQTKFGKLRLIMWKNLILRRRHWGLFLLEFGIPTGLMALIVYLRVIPDSSFLPVPVEEITTFETANEATLRKLLCSKSLGLWNNYTKTCTYIEGGLPGDRRLFWGPPNKFTEEMVELLQKDLSFKDSYLVNCTSNEEINNQVDKSYFESNESLTAFYIGVFFHLEDPDSDDAPQYLTYDLRLQQLWMTDYVYPLMQIPGPRNYSATEFSSSYTMDGFTILQFLIDRAYMRILTNYDSVVDNIKLETQMYPYPPYVQDHGMSQVYGAVLPSFIVFSLILLSPTLIKSIVYEKETGVRELLRMMGLEGWLIWVGWFLYSFTTIFIVCVIVSGMLKVEVASKSVEGGVIPPILIYSDATLVWFILILYGISSICFCFAISCFFSNPTLATTIGVLLWLLSFFIPADQMSGIYDNIGLAPKLFSCLLPNMAMTWAFRIIGMFEGRAIGIQWNNLWDTGNQRDELTIAMILIMLSVDTLLFSTVTWYVDHVLPGIYGVPLPWNFPFSKSYWKSKTKRPEDVETFFAEPSISFTPSMNSSYFEAEPHGLKIGIGVRGLRKEFKIRRNEVKVAVDSVDLTCYEGQCTVLLGHNGAGKTTTMSVLTGIFPPTGGSAVVDGWNIKTNLKEARAQLGLCPQHNTLFTNLSVKQHLLFFARLKGLSKREAETEADTLLRRLELDEKQDQFGAELSGGMKRKLCLAIALIGGSRVIILDEPSSGLDPESRRWVWEVIQQERGYRTVLVTTHHMEEADILGDRVAIMANGRIVCCGSSLFLKNTFGDGYTLSVMVSEESRVANIEKIVTTHIEEASLRSSVNDTLLFRLPPETHKFPYLLDSLNSGKDALGISHMGLTLTTMEQVFLKVGDLLDKEEGSQKNGVFNTAFGEEPAENNGAMRTEDSHRHMRQESKSVQQYRKLKLEGWKLLQERTRSLFVKKFIYSKRKWLLLITQALIPVVVTLTVLIVDASYSEQQFMEPPRELNLGMFQESFSSVEFHDDLVDLKNNYISLFHDPYYITETDNISVTLLNASYQDLNIYRENYITSALFQKGKREKVLTRMMYQSIPYHTPGVGMNLIDNAVLRTILNMKNYSITTYNAPLPVNKAWQIDEDPSTYSSTLFGLVMPVAMAFLTSSFLIFPFQERTSKAKQIQLMTGTPTFLLWATCYIWDLITYMASALLMLICFVALDSKGYFTAKGAPGAIFFLFLLYGLGSIPMAYVFSFPFQSAASGFAVLALVNIIAGMIISSVTLALKMTGSETLIHISCIIGNITSFVPSYPASRAFMSIVDVSNYNNMCNVIDESVKEDLCRDLADFLPNSSFIPCCPEQCVTFNNCFERVSYLSWQYPGEGMYLMYLFIDMIFYFFILYLVEIGLGDIISESWFTLTARYCKPKDISTESDEFDDDVTREQDEAYQLMESKNVSSTALVVKDLTKEFVKFGLVAVKGISFHFNKGECFGLLGVNGAGKTTTFRMLTGDTPRTSGDARINNNYLSHGRRKFMEEIGYCPQFDAIIEELTGEEMLALMAGLRGVPRIKQPRLLKRLINLVDLTECHKRPSSTYSGGNKRKLSTAMALVGQPPMVFLDEPTSGVDPASRRRVWEAISDATKNGQSVILTSHSMDECETLCSKVVIMVRGSLKCVGTPQYLKYKYGQGYTLQVKIKSSLPYSLSAGTSEGTEKRYKFLIESLKEIIIDLLPRSVLTDEHRGMLVYRVPSSHSWSSIFHVMENLKLGKVVHGSFLNRRNVSHYLELKNLIEDYAAMDPSLEQVFLSFARESNKRNSTMKSEPSKRRKNVTTKL